MGAVLQLERFDHADSSPPATLYTSEDVQDAYARGMIAGRVQGNAEGAEQMHSALTSLAAQVDALSAEIAQREQTHARSLAPLIGALIDGVLPSLARVHLESALLGTFLQLAENVSPLSIRLRCGPDLSAFVTACADEAGVSNVTLASDGPAGTVTAELLGGVMSWNEAEVAEQLRRLVLEVMEEN